MGDGCKCDKKLVENIKKKIRDQLNPRHVPAFILPIDDILVSIILWKATFWKKMNKMPADNIKNFIGKVDGYYYM